MATLRYEIIRGFFEGIGRILSLEPDPTLMYRFESSAQGLRYDYQRIAEDIQEAWYRAALPPDWQKAAERGQLPRAPASPAKDTPAAATESTADRHHP